MLAYSLKRLGLAVLVALAVSALTFLLLRASGDVAIALAGEGARTEDIENIRRIYGLDRPLIVQYVDVAVTDAARRLRTVALFQDRRPCDLVLDKLPTTAILALLVAAVRARRLAAAGGAGGALSEQLDRSPVPAGRGGRPGAAELLLRA